MAVSKEILDLIPQGCKVNWNEKQQRFYVYKSTYYYPKSRLKVTSEFYGLTFS